MKENFMHLKNKHFHSTILTLSLCGILFCNGQLDNRKTHNKTYTIGSIPDLNNFEKLNTDEKHLDSLENQYNHLTDSLYQLDTIHLKDDLLDKKDFRNNRSRIYLNIITNRKLSNIDSVFNTGISTPCRCLIEKDTIFVSMGIGFFGGFGFNIKLVNNNFFGSFFQYTDDVKPFKSDLNDSAYYDFVEVQNKYQYLTLREPPTFQSGEQLTGFMTFTTNNFYEQVSYMQLDSNYVTGKLYFTCKTLLKSKWE